MVALARSHVLQPQVADKVEFAADVVAGLGAAPKRLPAKYFYDATGSHLFERITELPEYYPTRTEMTILRDQAADIAKQTDILLGNLEDAVPVDRKEAARAGPT